MGRSGDSEARWHEALPAANELDITDERNFEITSASAVFFRVVAIDERGARSTPSRCVGAPQPRVLPSALPPAAAGRWYRATLSVRANAGQWIVNIRPDLPKGVIRHGADRLHLAIMRCPKWLSVDAETGQLLGVPGAADVGRHDVFVEVMDGNGRGHSTQLMLEVLASGAEGEAGSER